MNKQDLRDFLEEKVVQYNKPDFIESDPISIPHQYSKKQDVEISAFIAATLAWGQRKTILNNCSWLMEKMEYAPHDFIVHHDPKDLLRFRGFVHRTFNYDDLIFLLTALQQAYQQHNSLEELFVTSAEAGNLKEGLHQFRETLFKTPHLARSEKHISDPYKNSACKRLCMFLRWMIRKDAAGVDFGIWNTLSPAQLSCPLDVHTGNVSRALGILKRTQNDWKTVEELDAALRNFDPKDPVKYDFALFGLGVFEGFGKR
jgi:uncharacterized protein (TIGR02757 family)